MSNFEIHRRECLRTGWAIVGALGQRRHDGVAWMGSDDVEVPKRDALWRLMVGSHARSGAADA